MRIIHLIGIAGVEAHERVLARFWARRLEWLLLAVTVWIPFQWYLEETQSLSMQAGRIADWFVWLAFLFETTLLTLLVKEKSKYLAGNWMNLLIILVGLPLFWEFDPMVGLLRSLRLMLVVVLLLRMSSAIRQLLTRHQLGAILAVAFATMVISGMIVTRLDPTMGDAWDGMWWAWVTMSTVGYGDIVPENAAGRLFGSLLILFGVVLVSLLTANLSAFFVGSDVQRVEQEEKEADRMLKDMAVRLERIERLLEERQPAKGN